MTTCRRVAITVAVGKTRREETSSTRTEADGGVELEEARLVEEEEKPAGCCSAQAQDTAARKLAGWTVATGERRSSTVVRTALLLPTSHEGEASGPDTADHRLDRETTSRGSMDRRVRRA